MDEGGSTSDNKENEGSPVSPFMVPPTPLLKRIGYGTGVNVYHLDRSPLDHKMRSPWALKKVNKNHKGGEISRRMFFESEILKSLNHPNIVGFRGYTKTDDGRGVLALESCSESLGDLIEERRENSMKRFSPQDILMVAKGMVQGLHYLHTVAHLLHGDIKSYNVLVKDRNFRRVKLCDFGVSLQVDDEGLPCDKKSAEHYTGTEAWSAPEVLSSVEGGQVTTKADIFSLGLTLWEMMTLYPPHLNMSSFEESDSFVDNDASVLSSQETFGDRRKGSLPQSLNHSCHDIRKGLDRQIIGQRPTLPDDLGPSYNEIVKIFNWCTEEDPRKRPSAKELIVVLDRIQL